MSYDFDTKPWIRFDEAMDKLRSSGKVLVEPPPRMFLFEHMLVTSLDGCFGTSAGRLGPGGEVQMTEEDRHRDPKAGLYFFKCFGEPREEARRFLVMLAEILGVDIVTEYGDSVSDVNAWSVRYLFEERSQ